MAGIIVDGVVAVKFVAPMQIISNQPAFVSDTLSLKQNVAGQKTQRWEITTNLEPSNSSADFLIHSVTRGYGLGFNIQMPQVFRPFKATTSTSIKAAENLPLQAITIALQNNGKVAKGEFITFANHSKVYVLTDELSGNGRVGIYPPLRAPVPLGTTVNFGDKTQMVVRYAPETALGITYVDGILSDPGTVKFVEKL